MDLIIIGNGFDMNEGLQTSYNNLRIYIEKNNELLFGDLLTFYYSIFNDFVYDEDTIDLARTSLITNNGKSCYPKNNYLWSDFERNIANPSIYNIRDEYGFGKFPMDNYQQRVDEMIELYDKTLYKLKIEIKKWIKTIKTESLFTTHFINKAYFISFNYTKTLEERYNVSKELICYLHNSIRDESIIFGFDKEEIDRFKQYLIFNCEESDEDADYFYLEQCIYTMINKYVKPSKSILHDKLIPFCENKIFDRIFVLGSSIGNSDKVYFEYLIKKYNSSKWYISYYKKFKNDLEDLNEKENFFNGRNIEVYFDDINNLIEVLIEKNIK